MTVKDAYTIFANKFAKLVTLSCYEYDSRFVFQAIPKKYADTKDANGVFDSLYSVEKKSGALTRFRPTDISADEYAHGHKRSISELLKSH